MNIPVPLRLSSKEAAAYLGVSESTLAKWRLGPDGPTFHYLGHRRIYYLLAELDAWLVQCDERAASKVRV